VRHGKKGSGIMTTKESKMTIEEKRASIEDLGKAEFEEHKEFWIECNKKLRINHEANQRAMGCYDDCPFAVKRTLGFGPCCIAPSPEDCPGDNKKGCFLGNTLFFMKEENGKMIRL